MGKFSKIFKHIESKDLRNKYEQKKVAKIQEEKKKEDTKKYIASAMEQVKYNWRSDIDVGAAIREGMTTSDVTVSKEIEAAPGDGEVSSLNAIDASSYTATTGVFAPGDNLAANVGTTIRTNGSGSGQDGGFNVGGNYLAFQGTGTDDSANSRFAVLSPIDSTDVDTLQIKAIVGNDSNGGEDPDENGEQLYVMYKTPAMDQAMFLIQKPDGSIPDGIDTNSDKIIKLGAAPNSGLNDYSVEIPDYARASGTQFILIQPFNSGPTFDNYGVTEIKFQRKAPITVFVPLDNPEASSFVRGAEQGSTPKKRKKDVDDKLEASDEYTKAKFGNEFPGQEVRVGGEDPFKSKEIGDDVEPSPQNRDEVLKKFSRFSDQATAAAPQTTVRGAPTAQPEAEPEPEPVAPSAQATMAPTTDDGDPINVKTVGGKNSGVVQGADAAAVDTQEPETTEPETTEPEIPEPEPPKPEPPDETKTPEEVEKIENEKFNAKADESADYIDKLVNFDLNAGLSSFNAFAQVAGTVVNTAINVISFGANLLGFKTSKEGGYLGGLGKIKNSIKIAQGVLSGKIVNANPLPQEIKSFTDSIKLDEFTANKPIYISDVRHEYADKNIYVKDGKVYQNGDGTEEGGGLYATPLAERGYEALGVHGSGYAQMIIPKDGSEPYLHYYDHNYENLGNYADVSVSGGIIQTLKTDSELRESGVGPLMKSISNIIHQLKGDNMKFVPQKLRQSLVSYFGAFDQVMEGLKSTSSLEGFPPGIHGSALTDFKVPLSKLPQETQDMIAGHPLSWTPERIENMTPEQINEQLYPLLETEEQFQNYLDFTTDITKMSTEPVNTVPYAVAMQEMDEIYSEFESFDQEFNELLEKGYNESPFTQAERAAYDDMQTLEAQNDKDIKENQNKLGPSAQSALWDKLVKPAYDAFVKATTGGSVSGNSPIKKRLDSQYAKWKKQADKMEKD